MNTERLDLLLKAIEDVYDDRPVLISHIALARECVRQIDRQIDDLQHDKRCLQADAARLRRELDDEMGLIR